MVSFFFFKPRRDAFFYREIEVSLPCQFPRWDYLPQKNKPHKLSNFGSIQICPSSIEFTSLTNTNNEVKRRYDEK